MYTEEVGVSPEAGGGAALYRARVAAADLAGLVVRPDRGRPGRVQGRGRLPRRRTPARSRACTSPPTGAARGWPPPGMAAVVEAGAARDRPGGVALRQRLQPAGPRGVRAGPASRETGDLHHHPVLTRRRSRPTLARATVPRCPHTRSRATSRCWPASSPSPASSTWSGRETFEPLMPALGAGAPRGHPRQRRRRARLRGRAAAPRAPGRRPGWASAALLVGVFPGNVKMAVDASRTRTRRTRRRPSPGCRCSCR